MRHLALPLVLLSSACASTRIVERPISETDRNQIAREMLGAPDVRWRDERGEERVAAQVGSFLLLPEVARFEERCSPPGAAVQTFASREVPVEALREVRYRTERATLRGALAGSILGGVGGALGGGYLGTHLQGGGGCDSRSLCAGGAYLGVVVGAVLGGLIGGAAPVTHVVFR